MISYRIPACLSVRCHYQQHFHVDHCLDPNGSFLSNDRPVPGFYVHAVDSNAAGRGHKICKVALLQGVLNGRPAFEIGTGHFGVGPNWQRITG